MGRIEKLKASIDGLYRARHVGRAEWADWLYANHVFLVADRAGELGNRYGAKMDLAMAAGMLHDIADAVMSRFDPKHEEEGLKIARNFLETAGFTNDEIAFIVDDAIRFHGCHGGNSPKFLEGKVMATADALVHLKSDFYKHAFESMKLQKTDEQIRDWALPKIERDFNDKIQFDEIRESIRTEYLAWKDFFSRDPLLM